MGLNFQTCTIINSNVDSDSRGAELFKGEEGVLRIKRDFVFKKEYVERLAKAEGHEPKPCKAEIDFSSLSEGNYRLDVFAKYEGAEPFYGANPMYTYKGIPFWVEFSVKSGASDIAEKIAAQIKKDHLFLIDKDVMEVKAEGNVLTLTGATEYLRFGKIYVSNIDTLDEEVVLDMESKGVTEIEPGVNGFGTYSQIIKDLRLPTAANYQWTHIRQAETPVVGAIYDQYIIDYCAPAINDGTQFVGHRGNNHTTHVFWVNQAIASKWEEAWNAAFGESEESEELEA